MNTDDDLVRRGDVFAIIQESLANAEAEGPDASLRAHLHIGIADVPTAPPPSPAWEGSLAQRNLGDAWVAMRMIREAVETLGPIGAMPAEEHIAGPTFLHEAEAIVAGIMKMKPASPASPSGVEPTSFMWTDELYAACDAMGIPMHFATMDKLLLLWRGMTSAAQFASLASDATPAPTSGSEDASPYDDAVQGDEMLMELLNAAVDENIRLRAALAKPASEPAGGDVRGKLEQIIALREEGDCKTLVEAEMKTLAQEALAALSSSAGPAGEAVAWVQPGYLSMLQKYGSCSMRFEPIDALDYIVPIYAHPAPATVESDRINKLIDDFAEEQDALMRCTLNPQIGEMASIKKTAARQIKDLIAAALAPATEEKKKDRT